MFLLCLSRCRQYSSTMGTNLDLLIMYEIKPPPNTIGQVLTTTPTKGAPSGPLYLLWRAEMTRQTSESKKHDDDADITVLFGTDEHGKPRAAWFKAANPELITKAATAMKLQLLRPITPN